MHPITVYGIETVLNDMPSSTLKVACTLLPFTVLKQLRRAIAEILECCMHPITVYGIETFR